MYAPIMNFLADGAPHKRKEIKTSLVAVFSLTLDEQIMQTGGRGVGIFDSKVNDALFYLLKTGMIEQTETTVFKITERGMDLQRLNLRVIDDEILTKHGNGFIILNKQQEPGKRPEPAVRKPVHEKIMPPSRPNAAPPKARPVPAAESKAPAARPAITVVKKDLDFKKIINTSRQGPWRQRVERFTGTYSSKMTAEESDAIKRITKNKDKNLQPASEDVKQIDQLLEKLYAEEGKKLLSVLFVDEKGQDVSPDV
ncbi:winged helix-turn-helix domain-containing protein [Methanocorpusculum sp.]